MHHSNINILSAVAIALIRNGENVLAIGCFQSHPQRNAAIPFAAPVPVSI